MCLNHNIVLFEQQMRLKQKPLALVCYLCGRQFGTQSLKIHLKTCKSKWQLANSKQLQGVRMKSMPEQPALLQQILCGRLEFAEEYNRVAANFHKYQVMPACPHCHRTFNEDSLNIHQKVCPKKPKDIPYQPKVESSNSVSKGPRTLVCCICGREFGLASLKIHYPQCCQKFKAEENRKEKGQRRIPAAFDKFQLQMINEKEDWSFEDIKRFNQKAMLQFQEHSKVHCQGCKRRFLPDAYNHHLKHCQLHSPHFQTTQTETSTIPTQPKMPKVLVCHICGQQFGIASLLIHQKTCKIKFLSNQQLKPTQNRRSLPTFSPQILQKFNFKAINGWNQQQVEDYNSIAAQVYRTQGMQKCSYCQRTFNEQAYEKHLSYCNRQREKEQAIADKNNQNIDSKITRKRQPSFEKEKKPVEEVPMVVEKKQQRKTNLANFPIIDEESLQDSQELQANLPKQPKENQMQQVVPYNYDRPIIEAQHTQQEEEPKYSQKQAELECQPEQTEEIQSQAVTDQPTNLEEEFYPTNPFEQNKIEEQVIAKQTKPDFNISFAHPKPTLKYQPQNKQPETNPTASNNYQASSSQNQLSSLDRKEIQQIQLSKCSKCGRKFLVERLIKHESVCKGVQKFVISSQNTQHKKETIDVKPIQQKQVQKRANVEHSNYFSKDKPSKEQKLEKLSEKENKRLTSDAIVNQLNQNSVPKYNLQGNQAVTKTKYQEQYKQFTEEGAIQLAKCTKCNRNFNIQRIDVHERVCMGQPSKNKLEKPNSLIRHPVGLKQQREQQKLSLEDQQLTAIIPASKIAKHKIMNMLKEIKSRKVKDSEIDQQLDVQLKTIEKGLSSGRIREASQDHLSKQQKQVIGKSQEVGQYQRVGKWKKKRRSTAIKQI